MDGEKMTDFLQSILKETSLSVEILALVERRNFIRFANSVVHQNTGINNTELVIKVLSGKNLGISVVSNLKEELIKKGIEDAYLLSKSSKAIPDFPGFSTPEECGKINLEYEESENLDVVFQTLGDNFKRCSNFELHGLFTYGTTTVSIVNSNGVKCTQTLPDSFYKVIAKQDNISGYADFSSHSYTDVPFSKVAESACEKVTLSQPMRELKPGKYSVILGSNAVAQILQFMSYLGMNALAVQEKRSFIKIGEKIFDPKVTIVDDPYNKDGFPLLFDFEGTPSNRVVIIENGIAKNVVYDRITAAKEGRKSTGHSTGSISAGPIPMHIMMKGGGSTLKQMIEKTKRAILITRFHYVNVVDPISVTLTGMTRDGTFLIEDGEIVCGLRNLRFTQSMVEAFNDIEHISEEIDFVRSNEFYDISFPSGYFVPSVKIRNFNFSGVSNGNKINLS